MKRTKTPFMQWIDRPLDRDPLLRRHVEETLNKMRLDQDLATLRAARRLSQSRLASLPGAREAPGHYWQNLFAVLAAEGFAVALLNPMRTRRFAGEDLARAKTDALDAVGIARFAAQKRPAVPRLPEAATQELRELVRLRDRLRQEFGDRTRQLHRLVDLGFPEFTRVIPDLKGRLATGLLARRPTAAALPRGP